MNKTVRLVLSVLLLLVFLGSTGMMIRQSIHNKAGVSANEEAVQLAGLQQSQSSPTVREEPEAAPEPSLPDEIPTQITPDLSEQLPLEPLPEVWVPAPVENDPQMEILRETDLKALREVNPDVVGWIMIPDTSVNACLLQGEENEYYLNHTWDQKYNTSGSIFLECQNAADLTDFNTIIYGHNMKNGIVFSQLPEYADEAYWAAHPYVYIVSDQGVFRYEIFSAYETEDTSDTYLLGFSKESKADFLQMAREQSVIDTGIIPAVSDRILTLSTCTNTWEQDLRWVVQARLPMIDENAPPDRQ